MAGEEADAGFLAAGHGEDGAGELLLIAAVDGLLALASLHHEDVRGAGLDVELGGLLAVEERVVGLDGDARAEHLVLAEAVPQLRGARVRLAGERVAVVEERDDLQVGLEFADDRARLLREREELLLGDVLAEVMPRRDDIEEHDDAEHKEDEDGAVGADADAAGAGCAGQRRVMHDAPEDAQGDGDAEEDLLPQIEAGVDRQPEHEDKQQHGGRVSGDECRGL